MNVLASRTGRRVVAWLALVGSALSLVSGCAYIETKQRELIWRPGEAWWASFDPQSNGVQELWIPRDGGPVQEGSDPPTIASSLAESPSAQPLAQPGAQPGAVPSAVQAGTHLHAWWWPDERLDAPVLLYFHGARWNLQGNGFRIARLRKMGFSVMAIDYRGFGKSGGDLPSEEEVYADATVAWEYVAKRVPEASRRFVYGHSLGGAIAIELASRRNDMAGVIVESTITSIRDMASTHTLLRLLPIGLFLTQHYDSLSRVERVAAPMLFVHGANDRFVPVTMTQQLYERARGPKRLLLVEGANHSNAANVGFEQYRTAVRDFFDLDGQRQAALP
jgi:uncharacterized protein